jgi:hypothetical protein
MTGGLIGSSGVIASGELKAVIVNHYIKTGGKG